MRTDYWYAAKASCFFRMNSVGAALGRGLFAIAITVGNVLKSVWWSTMRTGKMRQSVVGNANDLVRGRNERLAGRTPN